MAYRRSQSNGANAIFGIVIALSYILAVIMYLIFKVLSFGFDLITLYTSGYKLKSGNGFLKTYFDKGKYGEFRLYRLLVGKLGKSAVFTNLYLDNERTDQTEIDVVAITDKFVYVFEMKNYGGAIYGSEHDQYWTQFFTRFIKHKFYNPLRQNYAHTKAIENYLNVSDENLFPVVVFSNRSKLSKINISDKHTVIQLSDVKRMLRVTRKMIVNPMIDINAYKEKLILRSLMPDEVKLRHIEEVKALKEKQEYRT